MLNLTPILVLPIAADVNLKILDGEKDGEKGGGGLLI